VRACDLKWGYCAKAMPYADSARARRTIGACFHGALCEREYFRSASECQSNLVWKPRVKLE
jgi:hypothetical protein